MCEGEDISVEIIWFQLLGPWLFDFVATWFEFEAAFSDEVIIFHGIVMY